MRGKFTPKYNSFVLVGSIVVLLLVLVPLVGTAGAVAENNTTNSEVVNDTENCSPGSGGPTIDQAVLQTENLNISPETTENITGSFRASPTNECPIVVSVVLNTSSGLRITGGSEVDSMTSFMAESHFIIQPASIKDTQIEVRGVETGTQTVTADVTYWPRGYVNRSKTMSELSAQIDVAEGSPSETTTEESSTSDSTPGFGFITISIAGLTVLGLSRRFD